MKPRLKLYLAILGAAIVLFFAVMGVGYVFFHGDPPHVYVVSPGLDLAEVTVFSCANIGFEDRRKAEQYSREHPGTHVFEVSFRELH